MPPETPAPISTERSELLQQLRTRQVADVVVVGGGATGLGVALDAAARGLSVVLLESHDFAKGTSSRATKLVHGGVRYLAQGNIALVREALHERTTLLHNAPHLAQPLAFVMPSYHLWETPFYGIGLKAYDALAGKAGLGATRFLSRARTLAAVPGVQPAGLKGGVLYWDGQFDDARLAIALARTAAQRGALLINYCAVTAIDHEDGKVSGVRCEERETGEMFSVRSRCVVNAAGVWVDRLRELDGEATGQHTTPLVAPSQGVHIVVDREFLPGDNALLVPKTTDGRVLFAVPWLGKVILGTTDTPRNDLAREPRARDEEIAFVLGESARYLRRAPQRRDIRSVWVGLRPLVKPQAGASGDRAGTAKTKALSREHTVLLGPSGLVTVTGGKWTTYRAMAEDVLQRCMDAGLLANRPSGITVDLPLVGAPDAAGARRRMSEAPGWQCYGTESAWARRLPGADIELIPGFNEAMVRFAYRYEYARTVEDVLARRSRLLFLDAALAASLGARVARILQEEGAAEPAADAFSELALQYQGLAET